MSAPYLDGDVLTELATVKAKVRYLLEAHPSARNSDTYLQWLYLRTFHKLNMPWVEFEQFSHINLENIRRTRQLIQSQGELLPTDPEVARVREAKREAMRRVIPRLNGY